MGLSRFMSGKTAVDAPAGEKGATVPADSNEAAREGNTFVEDVDGAKGGTGAGNFLKGDYERQLSLFDKKAALINQYVHARELLVRTRVLMSSEMDKFGMGRYQICIWFLTGVSRSDRLGTSLIPS